MVPTADESSFDYSQQEHEITLYSKASTSALMHSQWRRREAKHLTPPNAKMKMHAISPHTHKSRWRACGQIYLQH